MGAPRVIRWLLQAPQSPRGSVTVCVPTEPEWRARHHQLRQSSKPPGQEAARVSGNGIAPPHPVSYMKCLELPKGPCS